ncbi:15513_t:CDS:2 [Funneliformis geosporum]|uniref:7332_t:CDS:1 n=1 Tax=Funneliformis geosporum TaxID=1117311 RepID=A0A9W4SBY5_9GLOM|nr:15513_t:CDS:2 [Funneliformis geosporum]CAI2163267.1 7332_t:CDS:2 [Funneliformis geosporum]
MSNPSHQDYSRRHQTQRDRDRNREHFTDPYRDLDRPLEDPYHDQKKSKSPHVRERVRDRDRRERRRTPERNNRYRSRSRSPINRRDRAVVSPRGTERERDRKDERYDRDRKIKSRSGSPRKEDTNNLTADSSIMVIDPNEDPDQALMKAMGIAGFNTTKGKRVVGNDIAAVSIKKQRQYRQYMNRRGGFNR